MEGEAIKPTLRRLGLRRWLRWHRRQFMLWTIWPGDRYEDFQLAMLYEVVVVKPDYVIVRAWPTWEHHGAGQIVKAWRRADDGRFYDTKPMAETTTARWMPL